MLILIYYFVLSNNKPYTIDLLFTVQFVYFDNRKHFFKKKALLNN